MSVNINNKRNMIISLPTIITNLYSGTQYSCSNGKIVYNYETDIFKNYGFTTCMKLETSRVADGSTKFMSYSYLLAPNLLSDPKSEYVVNMYAYCSNDCNANLKIRLEHSNTWTSAYIPTVNNYINDPTKEKVIWIWGRFKPNQSDGNVYLMFYPNLNQIDIFTQGYQLFAGITVYKGTEIFRPSVNNIIHGLYTNPHQSCIKKQSVEFDDILEI